MKNLYALNNIVIIVAIIILYIKKLYTFFLAELFTTAMLFKWKGERTKSHEK